jgi:hypothetical protein
VRSYFSGVLAIAGVVLTVASQPAGAIGYTLVQNDIVTVPSISNGFYVPNFVVGSAQMDYVNSSSEGQYRSPWQSTSFDTLQYTSVRDGVAGYNISGTSLSLFWGSPDWYNTLTFYTGLNGTGDAISLTGALLGDPQAIGHHLVRFLTDEMFRSITIASSQPAFEFANLMAATPIPAALPLFATGLGVIGWFARRRKRQQSALGPS